MSLRDSTWYIDFGNGSTTGYYAVTKWAAATVTVAGTLIRQNTTPAVGSERVFVCIVAGTTAAVTEPTWVVTRGGKTTDGTVTWMECTGIAALNGDQTDTLLWSNALIKGNAITQGNVIQRVSGGSYQICTTAGTAGSGAEPAFSNTAGVTTVDSSVTWTSLGPPSNFTGWQAPHARLLNAFTITWGQAGNNFFVASEHAETQSTALTLLSQGTNLLPCSTYCVNKSNVPPTSANITTGATITTTGNSGITVAAAAGGTNYFNGITFSCGTGANAPAFILNSQTAYYYNCALQLGATGAANYSMSSARQILYMSNTTMQFANAANTFFVTSDFVWRNTPSAITGSTFPTTFMTCNGNNTYVFEGVDLSALSTGTALINGAASNHGKVYLKDCKVGSGLTFLTGTSAVGSPEVVFTRCDSANTNYNTAKYNMMATQTTETTVVRTGGATDGTTPISWKIVTNPGDTWPAPFECIPIQIWNNVVGSTVTATVCGIWGGGAVPLNTNIWMDVEYLSSSSASQGSFVTQGNTDGLAAGVNQTTDTSTWGGSTTPFKMVATFTPQQKGYITVYVKAALASNTFYVDPLITLS